MSSKTSSFNRRAFLAASVAALPLFAKASAIRVGCQLNVFPRPADFGEVLKRLADMQRLGFVALECNVRFVETEINRVAEAKAQIAGTGMQYYCAHTESGRPIDELKQKADVAAAFGAKRLAVNGTVSRPLRTEPPPKAELSAKIQKLDQLGAYCHTLGLQLIFHNHSEEFVADGFEMRQMMKQIPLDHLSLLLDIGFPPPGKPVVGEFFSEHSQRVDGLHLHDMRAPRPPQYDDLAGRIASTGWGGHLIVEELAKPTDSNLDAAIAENRDIIRKVFGA